MKRKDKSLCSLTISEWLQYITSETNRERYDFYNEEVSFLSKLVVVLSIISAVFGLLSIFNTFSFVKEELKVFYFIVFSFIFFVILFYLLIVLRKFTKNKNRMNKILNLEGDIIEDILNGKLKDPDETNRRYMSIWENK